MTNMYDMTLPQYLTFKLKEKGSGKGVTNEEAQKLTDRLYEVVCKQKTVPVSVYPSPKAAWDEIQKRLGEKFDFQWPYLDGHWWTPYLAFAEYNKEVEKFTPAQKTEYELLWDLTAVDVIYPFDDYCIMSQKPIRFEVNAENQLHSETGKAIEYADGFGFYVLNGVHVPEWLVMTPAEQIPSSKITEEKNVEIRREIVRKIGIEKMLVDLGAEVLNKDAFNGHEYELLKFGIKVNNTYPVYLKMKNPSIHVYHVEEVDPKCKTVRDAINFRKPPKLASIPVDDVNGESWFQQGDVCFWNKDAKSVKFFPDKLT